MVSPASWVMVTSPVPPSTVAFTGSHSNDELMARSTALAPAPPGRPGPTAAPRRPPRRHLPSLTPTGSGQLYLGFAQVDGGGQAGSTPGFSYTITSAEASVLCWDANVSSTVSPTASQTATGSDSVGALFAASGGGGAPPRPRCPRPPPARRLPRPGPPRPRPRLRPPRPHLRLRRPREWLGPVTTYMIDLTGGSCWKLPAARRPGTTRTCRAVPQPRPARRVRPWRGDAVRPVRQHAQLAPS